VDDGPTKFDIADSCLLRYFVSLDTTVFHGNNEFIIELIPKDLKGFTLHLKSAYLTESQKIYDYDGGVNPSTISTGN
jgi:hypothetical protein